MRHLFLAGFLILFFILQGRSDSKESRPKVYVPPPEAIKQLHFGYNESLADSFWLRYIQDMDVCYGKKLTKNKEKTICKKGWSYKLLDVITDLAPQFRMPYAVGATNLTILGNDIEGAKEIFKRGVKQHKDDWSILYRAAYFHLYESKDLQQAARLLDLSSEKGAPIWVSSLASRIWKKEGQLEFGIRSLKAYQKSVYTDEQRAHVQKRIDKLVDQYEKTL